MSLKQPLPTRSITESEAQISGGFCNYRGERFYKIQNYDQMDDFFMSVVSAYDHWLFISSNGGLTAGRKNSEKSLFPYYTEDKISDMAHCTGSITLIKEGDDVWRSFSTDVLNKFEGERNLFKSVVGDQLFFQENDKDLCVEYGWQFSDKYGLVKTTRITNTGENSRKIEVLDGLQNILPSNIASAQQSDMSVLLDAYKSVDLQDQKLAVYSLSSQLSDLAEPAESLSANIVWSKAVSSNLSLKTSISSDSIQRFSRGLPLPTISRERGKRGSYFVSGALDLEPGEHAEWITVGDVGLTGSKINDIQSLIKLPEIVKDVVSDIKMGQKQLASHLAKTDGLQVSQDEEATVHHTANTLFNMMRGGLFEDGYCIERADLESFVCVRNQALRSHALWNELPETLSVLDLQKYVDSVDSASLKRLVSEYLPISFSRRHGDPSRPWNRFSINLKDEQGNALKDYQGNWRDIFQNWEPLAFSYPEFLPAMISNFLNATTADGYNPYRVTRNGIEWEEPEPGNPWANIGYWSDHQIIYLAKLLELQAEFKPEIIGSWLTEKRFSNSNVPYQIKPFSKMVKDPHSSIEFDHELNDKIHHLEKTMGSDAKLKMDANNQVIHVNLLEKLLTLWLAKLSNFVPGGGIWMNTQRPEWNDANNALVGWGLSVVTLGYMHRHLQSMSDLLSKQSGHAEVSAYVKVWFESTKEVFAQSIDIGDSANRYKVLSELAASADTYRSNIYSGRSAQRESIQVIEVVEFLASVLPVIKDTLTYNEREDGLFHAYNLLDLKGSSINIHHLPEMLEGQVSILSAGVLTPEKSVGLLSSLRQSDLYRADQHTYLLYPNLELDRFLDKNNIDRDALNKVVNHEALITASILHVDSRDDAHFNKNINNARGLRNMLAQNNINDELSSSALALYEQTFNHKEFTGRSGSFFGYEGLGSTYWHMISKLLLAAQENWYGAVSGQSSSSVCQSLRSSYYDIRAGIGFNKSPEEYGAFPTDPYSHTPETGIARQPGMTGQVKEELITRLGEMGVVWKEGTIHFVPGLLNESEMLNESTELNYLTVKNDWATISVPANGLAFTIAQVPFVYKKSKSSEVSLNVVMSSGESMSCAGARLPNSVFTDIQQRNGRVNRVEVAYPFDIN